MMTLAVLYFFAGACGLLVVPRALLVLLSTRRLPPGALRPSGVLPWRLAGAGTGSWAPFY